MPECSFITSPEERWAPVVGYEKSYVVSTLGRVVSLYTGKLLEPQLFSARYRDSASNYLTVLLFRVFGEAPRRRAVHNLVLTAFCGPCPSGQACCHFDGDSLNNELTNLVWGVRQKKLGLVGAAPTLDEFKRFLRYDPHTGHFYWRVRPHWTAHSIRPGNIAGVLSRNGRVQIYYAGKLYWASHLAWAFMCGVWPSRSLDVEHRNANKVDNRWLNLFAVSRAKNLQNPNDKLSKGNRSGCRGVFVLPNKKCRAYITADGQNIRLGTYDTLEQAIAVRKAAELRYFSPGRAEALDFKLRAVLGDNYTLRRVQVVRPA